MERINILYGFDDEKVKKTLADEFRKKGYEANFIMKYSYISIKEYLDKHAEVSIAILSESKGAVKLSAMELAELADLRELNIVVLLNADKKGTEFVHTLYAAGITSGVFANSRNNSVKTKDIVELCIQKRTRKDARKYYAIDTLIITPATLSQYEFDKYLQALQDVSYGDTIGERYARVVTYMSPFQVEDFLRRMPSDLKEKIILYDSFYIVAELLKKDAGIDLKIKRPKKVIPTGVNVTKLSLSEEAEIQIDTVEEDIEENGAEDSPHEDSMEWGDLFGSELQDEDEEDYEEVVEQPSENLVEMDFEDLFHADNEKPDWEEYLETVKEQEPIIKKQEREASKSEGITKSIEEEFLLKEEKRQKRNIKIVFFAAVVVVLVTIIASVIASMNVEREAFLRNQQVQQKNIQNVVVISDNTVSSPQPNIALKEVPLEDVPNDVVEEVKITGIVKNTSEESVETKQIESGQPVQSVESTKTATSQPVTTMPESDYSYVPSEYGSEYVDTPLSPGSIISGHIVINIINATTGNFTVVTKSSSYSFTKGGATLKTIPVKSTYKVSGSGKMLTFTEI